MNNYKWVLKEINDNDIIKIKELYNINSLSIKALFDLGITKKRDIQNFLFPDPFLRISPYAFKDMRKAVSKIREHIEDKKSIYIFCDKDVDGITGGALLINLLEKLNVKVFYTLPVDKESYGFSERFVNELIRSGVKLLITVDVGITENNNIKKLKENGIDVIITDHHTPLEELPDAYAIINSKCETNFPDKAQNHSGCVAAFFLCEALLISYWKDYNKSFFCVINENGGIRGVILKALHKDEYFSLNIDDINKLKCDYLVCFKKDVSMFSSYKNLILIEDFTKTIINNDIINEEDLKKKLSLFDDDSLDLLANAFIKLERKSKKLEPLNRFFDDQKDLMGISTICDVMPLTGENRMYVKEAVKSINKNPRKSIRVLNSYLNYGSPSIIDVNRIGNYIGPAINSAGRIGDAETALNLLLNSEEKNIDNNVKKLLELNTKRKKMGDDAFSLAVNKLESQKNKNLLLHRDDDIYSGITGILAQKLSKHYDKPVFVFTLEEGTDIITASARAPKNINVLKIVEKSAQHIIQYGGHFSACGLKTSIDKYEVLKDEILNYYSENDVVNEEIKSIDLIPVNLNELTIENIKELIQKVGPFGEGNPKPLFEINSVYIKSPKTMGNPPVHVKFNPSDNPEIEFVGWNIADKIFELYEKKVYIDIAFEVEINYFRNNENVQLIIKDIRVSDLSNG